MFISKTLFVVGAGASCEAGLPGGEELKKKIASLLNIRFNGHQQDTGDYRIVAAFREAVKGPDNRPGDINPLIHKGRLIREVMPVTSLSIDNYLDTHRDDKQLALCGKLAIVKAILDAEKSSKLKITESGSDRFKLSGLDNTWYTWLIKLITTNLDKNDLAHVFDSVAFITFNYDRCIERFIRQSLKDHYNLNEVEASNVMSRLEIIHVYGQVGTLPDSQGGSGVAFGDNENSDLLSLAKGIKTFTERVEDEAVVNAIGNMVSKAETIVFLGFAFAEQNIRILSTPDLVAVKRCYGTTRGMSPFDPPVIKKELNGIFRNRVTPAYGEITMDLVNEDCNTLLFQLFRTLSSSI
jgi:hypothetical protein